MVAAGGSEHEKNGDGMLEYKWSSTDKESKILNTRQETYAGNTPIVVSPHAGGYTTKNRDVDAILSLYLGTLKVGIQPTEVETTIVNGFRRACEDEIRQLRAERQEKLLTIQSLCQELVCLEGRTAERQRHIVAASSILAPIRRLPVELLSRIFQLTIPERDTLSHPSESPLLLCRVSKVWRNIVINDPTMWSQILFAFPDEGEYMDEGDEEEEDSELALIYDNRLELLRLFASRSAAPVHLSHISVPHQQLETFVAAFGSEDRRPKVSSGTAIQHWRNFIIKCSNLRAARADFQPLQDSGNITDGIAWNSPSSPTSLTNLTSLSLKVAFGGSASMIFRSIDFPALRSLHLHAIFSSPFSLVPLGEPFTASIQRDMPYIARLTSLSLTHVQIEDGDLFALLLLTTQLEALSILRTDSTQQTKVHRSGMDDSGNLISFLTHQHHEPPISPPLPNLISLRLNHPLHNNTKEYSKNLNTSYSRLIKSRYEWNRHRSGVPLLHEGVSFESSRFKMYLTVSAYYCGKDRFHKLKAAMEEEVGPIHSRVLRVQPCGSPAFDDQPDLI
ncbi:unnamed protein product [Cyclocybe aegerita]|uniref:F-box domain-containing protein n=1 Tax=Cyclocybe aegerita TaxID=1973307 RepID=A0A8S0WYA3_CYCAE|nr:unnamed protein product [Cyclocybe aegerita]